MVLGQVQAVGCIIKKKNEKKRCGGGLWNPLGYYELKVMLQLLFRI